MIIRYPLTILTPAALLIAGGTAFAGGMPSDEGPEIILDTLWGSTAAKASTKTR